MNDLEQRRHAERDRYEAIHQADPFYGATNHGADARHFLINVLNAKSVIDVGCGDNSFVNWLKKNTSVDATGIDVADRRADFMAPAHDLPVWSKRVEWVTAFDLLEHLWPDEIDAVLAEFQRVASVGFLVSISYEPSKRQVEGGNLHRTVKPEAWWVSKLSKLATVKKHKGYLWGRWHHVDAG